eukprot:snap_masked-scaffold_1-processed-gene-22.40-mRNA-1 protein AED:1.00 eAED:1.00 QI:0/0/0/0/1/1/2/0/79
MGISKLKSAKMQALDVLKIILVDASSTITITWVVISKYSIAEEPKSETLSRNVKALIHGETSNNINFCLFLDDKGFSTA